MLRFLFRVVCAVVVTAIVAVVAFRISAANREVAAVEELVLAESRFVETVHGSLHALEAGPGDGQPVLLIHGSVGWSGLWRETSAFLAEAGFRVIALDLPPMGLSERFPLLDYSRQAQGLRILAFVEALEMQPIIVAHSFGAGAAFEALLLEPEDFTGAVVVAGALTLGQDGSDQDLPVPLQPKLMREAALASTVTNPYATKFLFQQFVHRKDTITRDVVQMLEYPFLREGTTGALAEWLPTLLIPPLEAASTEPERYGNVGLPVYILWGRNDTVTPPLQAEALSQALGGAPIFWMDDTGHIPQIEAPELFHQFLLEALSRIAGR